jgi:signal transduction histidine kinase
MASGSPQTPRKDGLLGRVATGFIAIGQGVAFCGLALAGLVLLVVPLAALGGLAFGFTFAITGPPWDAPTTPGTRELVLALMLVGLFVAFPVLFAGIVMLTRGLATRTRRLTGQWCGVPIAEPYRPRPRRRRRRRPRPRPGPGPQRPRERGIHRRLAWQLTDPATWRDLLWLAVNGTVAWTIAAAPAAMILLGLLGVTRSSDGPVPGTPLANANMEKLLLGVLLLVVAPLVAPSMLRGYALTARTMLAPSGHAELARRVQHLSQTRAETLDTGAAEIRRIERDLHDGAQARLVAMGMTLDAAGHLIDENPRAARALLIEARDNSAKALQELRALVRGIHPPVLADRGLADAIKALALDTPLRIHLASDLSDRGRPPAPVESAAYFAVSELIANVSKHAQASQAWVDIRHADGMFKIGVTDDGHGGADPHKGTGLHGIERRLAAFDGVLAISSPPGGPTAVTLEIPCVLS